MIKHSSLVSEPRFLEDCKNIESDEENNDKLRSENVKSEPSDNKPAMWSDIDSIPHFYPKSIKSDEIKRRK